MKAEKRIKINPKSGMALPAVLILLMIVSVLGTAMYAYSMQSIRSVRFASEGKKADYLARAGVESAAYAYQQATNKISDTSVGNAVNAFFNTLNSSTSNKIVSNDIYLVWDSGSSEYKYVLESEASSYDAKNVIGYFRVTVDEVSKVQKIKIKNMTKTATTEAVKDITTGIKTFSAVGVAGNSSRVKTGYVDNSVLCSGMYYGPNGIVDGQYVDNATYGGHTSVSAPATGGKPFIQSGSYHTTGTVNLKWKWLSSWLPISDTVLSFSTGEQQIPFALAYSAGNMVINDPSDTVNTLTFRSGQSNFVSFVGLNNTFCETNLDAESSNGCFNHIVLKGKEIVVDGSIDLSAYGFTRTSSTLFNNMGILADMMNAKYRYGTVYITSLDGYSAPDNQYHTAPYDYTRSGKVYFGGNVYVNITMPSVGTYRYKAFNSGDVYYFDADYETTRQNLLGDEDTWTDDTSNGGIDLMRYFLEKAIATNKYSRNVLSRFSDVIDFYYGNAGDEKTMVTNGNVVTRAYVRYKIDANGISTGEILYDAMRKVDNSASNPYGDTLASIIPPNPGNASALKWGKPEIEETTTAAGG